MHSDARILVNLCALLFKLCTVVRLYNTETASSPNVVHAHVSSIDTGSCRQLPSRWRYTRDLPRTERCCARARYSACSSVSSVSGVTRSELKHITYLPNPGRLATPPWLCRCGFGPNYSMPRQSRSPCLQCSAPALLWNSLLGRRSGSCNCTMHHAPCTMPQSTVAAQADVEDNEHQRPQTGKRKQDERKQEERKQGEAGRSVKTLRLERARTARRVGVPRTCMQREETRHSAGTVHARE